MGIGIRCLVKWVQKGGKDESNTRKSEESESEFKLPDRHCAWHGVASRAFNMRPPDKQMKYILIFSVVFWLTFSRCSSSFDSSTFYRKVCAWFFGCCCCTVPHSCHDDDAAALLQLATAGCCSPSMPNAFELLYSTRCCFHVSFHIFFFAVREYEKLLLVNKSLFWWNL